MQRDVRHTADSVSTVEARSLKAEQAEATRAALVKAARKLFAERGYAAVGTEEIVAAARVTRGALYHHFRDKRDLFRAVFAEVDRALVEDLAKAALAEDDPWRRLEKGCQAFLDGCLDQAVQRIVYLDAPSVLGWTEWRQAEGDSAVSLIEFGLDQAAEAGIVATGNNAVFAHLVMGALNEAGMFIANAEDTAAARREVGGAVDRLLEGLRTR